MLMTRLNGSPGACGATDNQEWQNAERAARNDWLRRRQIDKRVDAVRRPESYRHLIAPPVLTVAGLIERLESFTSTDDPDRPHDLRMSRDDSTATDTLTAAAAQQFGEVTPDTLRALVGGMARRAHLRPADVLTMRVGAAAALVA